jgi:hypothetical protein
MRHERHYTLEEARGLREWVAALVRRAQRALDELTGPRAQAAFDALDPATGGGWPGADVARAVLELQRAVGELGAADIVVRDLRRGLIDFPALREGREVYLCWLVDEPEIAFWHDLDAGFAGRRPLGAS